MGTKPFAHRKPSKKKKHSVSTYAPNEWDQGKRSPEAEASPQVKKRSKEFAGALYRSPFVRYLTRLALRDGYFSTVAPQEDTDGRRNCARIDRQSASTSATLNCPAPKELRTPKNTEGRIIEKARAPRNMGRTAKNRCGRRSLVYRRCDTSSPRTTRFPWMSARRLEPTRWRAEMRVHRDIYEHWETGIRASLEAENSEEEVVATEISASPIGLVYRKRKRCEDSE
ncbi:hypothetical protein DFH06DRAFT_1304125 [Mycena polygramma]|nr:hypothetical protein DFH06DRAFT_1304125 [Mycena polygramma]